jgi:hypothetical protein
MTREEFLAQSALVATHEEALTLLEQCGPDPVWFTHADGELGFAVWRLLGIQCTEMQHHLARLRHEQEGWYALRTAAQHTTDDLGLFQAGYERGYAQGWQHRGAQQKEETP